MITFRLCLLAHRQTTKEFVKVSVALILMKWIFIFVSFVDLGVWNLPHWS